MTNGLAEACNNENIILTKIVNHTEKDTQTSFYISMSTKTTRYHISDVKPYYHTNLNLKPASYYNIYFGNMYGTT